MVRAIPGATGQFQVRQEIEPTARLEVLAANGQQIVSQEVGLATKFDLSQDPAGIYIVRLRTSAGDLVAKILR